jgi:hypothetical protein
MAMKIDTKSEFGGRAERRLRQDLIYWLVTVGPDGTPQPSPVWALWDEDGTFLIYSRGGDIVIVTGEARIDPQAPPADRVPEYIAKYREGLRRIGMTPESFARAYSVAVRVTPRNLRGH